jgi:hypothetical protein
MARFRWGPFSFVLGLVSIVLLFAGARVGMEAPLAFTSSIPHSAPPLL